MNIYVFCASSDNLPKEYNDMGYEIGRLIVKGGHTLVFGGYNYAHEHAIVVIKI